MTRLRDHIRYGNQKGLLRRLRQLASNCRSEADLLATMTHLGQEYYRVLPGVLMCTARQLRIAEASSDLPIEVAAGACRTAFELNVRLRLVLNDREAMRDFINERLYDEMRLLESFKKLAGEDTSSGALRAIKSRKAELEAVEKASGTHRPPSATWRSRAEKAGVAKEYEILWSFYSNYTHATAWLVNASDAEHDGPGFREILAVQTQLYASDTLARIQELRKYLEGAPA